MCIATTSVCNLFVKSPVLFFTFCPPLAGRYSRFVRIDGSTGGRGVVTPFDTCGDKRKHGGGDNNKVNHRVNNDSGGRGGNSNNGGNDGGVGVETTAQIVLLPAAVTRAEIEEILMVVPSLMRRVSTYSCPQHCPNNIADTSWIQS